MSEFFRNRLETAHELIDVHDFDTAIEIIQNLKTRIHDVNILTKLNMHDSNVEQEYHNRYVTICQTPGDPYDQYNKFTNLRKWRAQEYLKFYDSTLRENDVQ